MVINGKTWDDQHPILWQQLPGLPRLAADLSPGDSCRTERRKRLKRPSFLLMVFLLLEHELSSLWWAKLCIFDSRYVCISMIRKRCGTPMLPCCCVSVSFCFSGETAQFSWVFHILLVYTWEARSIFRWRPLWMDGSTPVEQPSVGATGTPKYRVPHVLPSRFATDRGHFHLQMVNMFGQSYGRCWQQDKYHSFHIKTAGGIAEHARKLAFDPSIIPKQLHWQMLCARSVLQWVRRLQQVHHGIIQEGIEYAWVSDSFSVHTKDIDSIAQQTVYSAASHKVQRITATQPMGLLCST